MFIWKPSPAELVERIREKALRDHFERIPIGKWQTGEDLIAAVTDNGNPMSDHVAPAARGLILGDELGSYFEFSEPGKVTPIVIRPRALGFKKAAHTYEVRKAGLDLGLTCAPDDLPAAYMKQFGFCSTILFMTRDINPKLVRGLSFRVTTVDITQRVLGLWHSEQKIGPDTNVCFIA